MVNNSALTDLTLASFLFFILVIGEHPFRDKYLLYKWNIDESSWEGSFGEDALREALAILARIAPDALFRLALRKP